MLKRKHENPPFKILKQRDDISSDSVTFITKLQQSLISFSMNDLYCWRLEDILMEFLNAVKSGCSRQLWFQEKVTVIIRNPLYAGYYL